MPEPERLPDDATPSLQTHALDSVRYIRATMEHAGSFTAVPGWGMIAIGVTALPAAWLAARQPGLHAWIAVWCAEAVAALMISAFAITAKTRALGQPLLTRANRRFFASFSVPLLAAAVLSVVLDRGGLGAAIPGTWLLLYGTAVAAGGALSVRIVPLMGLSFMALGALTLLAPLPRDPAMAAGFGGLHLLFGAWIARRHGG